MCPRREELNPVRKTEKENEKFGVNSNNWSLKQSAAIVQSIKTHRIDAFLNILFVMGRKERY